MSLFKKDKIEQKRDQTKQEIRKEQLQKPGIFPDSQELASSKRRAQEQIKALEEKIRAQRELWSAKMKDKEEEKILLGAQLEMLVRKTRNEREVKESELTLMEQQIQRDLIEAQKSLETEIKSWSERLGKKDQEIEQTQQESELLEKRTVIENDQKYRVLKSELEQAEQKYRSMERKMLEEQNAWIVKIKSKEEEVLNTKTQILLKESQLAIENEKDLEAKKEKEAAWQGQFQELELKLKNQEIELGREYKKKQEELIAFKTALDARLGTIALEAEKKQRDTKNLVTGIEERVKIINSHIDEENKHWQAALKEREDEFNKLKVELMLWESQEKTEREKKYQEIKESETLAEKRIKDISQRINDEKENWKTSLKAKDDELKLLKISAELKLKEIKDMWEKKKKLAEEERAVVERKLIEVQNNFELEKTQLKNELDKKTAEMEVYRQEWIQKQQETVSAGENTLEELNSRRAALEKELIGLQESLQNEKAKWESLALQKEQEVSVARNELANQESSALKELERLDTQLKKEQQPLVDKLREIERRFEEQKKLSQAEIERKEAAITTLESQYRAREESIINRHNLQVEKHENIRKENLEKINKIKNALQEQSQAAQKRISKLKAEEETIKNNLLSQNKKIETEKKVIEEQYRERQEQLQRSIQELEKEHAEYGDKLNVELESKTSTLEDFKSKLREKENEFLVELRSKEQENTALKAASETELLKLTEALRKNNEAYGREMAAQRDIIESLQKSLREKDAQLHAELKDVAEQWEKKLQPLKDARKQLENKIASLKNETGNRMFFVENSIKETTEQLGKQEEIHARRIGQENGKITAAKERFAKDIAALNLQIETQSGQAKEALDKLVLKERTIENSIAIENQRLQSEKQRVTHQYENQHKQLGEAINRLEQDYTDYMKGIDGEIRVKNTELTNEKNKLSEIEENNRREILRKEQEFALLESQNRKELSALSSEYAKTANEYSQKCRFREETIALLTKTLEDNAAAFVKELEIYKANLAKELEPVLKQKQELKSDCERARKEAEDKLSAAAQKMETLRTEQRIQTAAFEKAQAEINAKMSAAKNEFESQIKTLLDKKEALEKDSTSTIALKESEINALETEVSLKKKDFEKQKEQLKIQQDTLEANLKAEILASEKDKANLEREYPEQLAAREKEISLLAGKIEQKTEENRDTLEQAEKGVENYQRRAERRIAQLKGQIAEVQEKHKNELETSEVKLANIRAESAKSDIAYQEELSREGKIFSEQKYILEKQKGELEEAYKSLQMRSKEHLRQKEKEVLMLQAELAEKERVWEESWKQKEQELSVEKNSLIQELESLDAKLKDEEENAQKRMLEKEHEIQTIETAYRAKLDNMADEMSSKKRVWDDTNDRLKKQLEELKNNLSALENNFESTKAQKEKELFALKSNLEFWELRAKSEEEKRLTAWEEERTNLETKVKEAESRLTALKKEYLAKYEEKENIFNDLKIRGEDNEKEKALELKKIEDEFAKTQGAYAQDIAGWEKKLKNETARTEKETKDIEREIEKTKLESALKENAAMSERQKSERKWNKIQRDLEAQFADLERQFLDEKENLKSRLSMKTEEISTLKVRMTLRDERRKMEIKHRQEETKKILANLEAELKAMEEKYANNTGAVKQGLEKSRKELETLKKEASAKEEKWLKGSEERENATSNAYEVIVKDLEDVEKELKKERERLERMLDVKEKQIENLTAQMKSKEDSLVLERDFSQMILQNLQKKAGDIQGAINRLKVTGKENEKENIIRIFEDAIADYNKGEYQKAKEKLGKILSSNAEFAGAYQYLALCCWNMGEKEESLKFARRAHELEPHNEELKLWIEYIQKELNK